MKIIALIIALASTGFAQTVPKLTYEQRMKLAYYNHDRAERMAQKSANNESSQPRGSVATVKDVTINIREATFEEIKISNMFAESQWVEYRDKGSKYFAIYKITFKNGGRESARFCPQTQTFYTKKAFVNQVTRRNSFDVSFMGAYNNYYDNLYTQEVEPQSSGGNLVMLPKTRKLIASVGVSVGKIYSTVTLEIGSGSKTIDL